MALNLMMGQSFKSAALGLVLCTKTLKFTLQ